MMTTLFDSGRSFRRAGIALAASASLLAMTGAAFATPVVKLTSAVGTWTSVNPANTTDLTGVGTSSVRWGSPQTSAGQSGYDFITGAPTSSYNVETNFQLGEFVHVNRPLWDSGTTPPSINSAKLRVDWTMDFDDGGTVYDLIGHSVFDFTHFETPNDASPCANPSADNSAGCADRVTLSQNINESFSFEHLENTYFLSILGFQDADGNEFTEFWTKENAENSAFLRASFTTTPNVAPIPLPAAAWMLIGGLGALGAVARRRKSAEA